MNSAIEISDSTLQRIEAVGAGVTLQWKPSHPTR